MAGGRLTILVSGMIAGDPHQGGATWAVLQYLLGFRRLGHEVYFVEPLVETALRPVGATLSVSTIEGSRGLPTRGSADGGPATSGPGDVCVWRSYPRLDGLACLQV